MQEAANDMISSDIKDQYHFDIRMALLHIWDARLDEKKNMLSAILYQINDGVPSLLSGQLQQISIAKIIFFCHQGSYAVLQLHISIQTCKECIFTARG